MCIRDRGKITLFGEDLSKFKENYKIGYVSQKANSFNSDFPATVKEVVMANLYSRRGLFKRYRKEDYEKLSTVLEKVGMSGYENLSLIHISAALLMVKGGVKEVYADIISSHALDVFEKYKVKTYYGNLVEYIINRDKTGMCPMEKAVLEVDEPNTAYDCLLYTSRCV